MFYTHTLVENVSKALLKQFICTTMQSVTMIPKTYVLGCVNWLLPANVNLTATPKPLMAIMETEPTREQIEIYTMGFVRPYFGTTEQIMKREKTTTQKQYNRNPKRIAISLFRKVGQDKISYDEHTWLQSKVQNLIHSLDRLVRRCMQNDDE